MFKGLGSREKEAENDGEGGCGRNTYAKYLNDRIEELRLVINESPLSKSKKRSSEKRIVGERRRVRIRRKEEGEILWRE